MPRIARELGALAVGKLTKPGLHAVGGVQGLCLNVTDTGARSWILRTTVGQRRAEIGLGPYPDVTLARARELAREAKDKVRAGVDPVEERHKARLNLLAQRQKGLLFKDAFRRFFDEKQSGELANEKHRKQWVATIERHAFPVIGELPVAEIGVQDVLKVLQPIWTDINETASRLRQRIEKVIDWAIVHGHREGENPARWKGNLEQILPSPGKVQRTKGQPAVALDELPAWYLEVCGREGIAAQALRFLTLTAARSGEVRGMTWSEVDLKRKLWIVPADRMKAKREHRVPLSVQAAEILAEVPRFQDVPYVFPAPRGGMLSDMTLSAVMRRIQEVAVTAGSKGYLDPRSGRPAVPHGLRSSFRDWAGEKTHYTREMAEMALAHFLGTDVEKAYRRGDMLEKRREMMEDWARFVTGT